MTRDPLRKGSSRLLISAPLAILLTVSSCDRGAAPHAADLGPARIAPIPPTPRTTSPEIPGPVHAGLGR